MSLRWPCVQIHTILCDQFRITVLGCLGWREDSVEVESAKCTKNGFAGSAGSSKNSVGVESVRGMKKRFAESVVRNYAGLSASCWEAAHCRHLIDSWSCILSQVFFFLWSIFCSQFMISPPMSWLPNLINFGKCQEVSESMSPRLLIKGRLFLNESDGWRYHCTGKVFLHFLRRCRMTSWPWLNLEQVMQWIDFKNRHKRDRQADKLVAMNGLDRNDDFCWVLGAHCLVTYGLSYFALSMKEAFLLLFNAPFVLASLATGARLTCLVIKSTRSPRSRDLTNNKFWWHLRHCAHKKYFYPFNYRFFKFIEFIDSSGIGSQRQIDQASNATIAEIRKLDWGMYSQRVKILSVCNSVRQSWVRSRLSHCRQHGSGCAHPHKSIAGEDNDKSKPHVALDPSEAAISEGPEATVQP